MDVENIKNSGKLSKLNGNTMARNEYIDFLRFIGLALIIFAHVDPPKALFQLRNFDVPLMVLVSALSFEASYRAGTPYLNYISSRLKRLAVPVWIFLSFFFIALTIFDPNSTDLVPQTIIASYALQQGIGFVWIIRIFLLVALMAPLIYKFHKSKASNLIYLGTLFLLYILYEAILPSLKPHFHTPIREYLSSIILYIVPYSLLFAYGLRMTTLKQSDHILMMAGSTVVFLSLGTILYVHTGGIVPTQEFKYPPTAYYLSFSLMGCEFVWLLGKYVFNNIEKLARLKRLIIFIGQNTLWIYLWHIPLIKYLELNFVAKYIMAFGFSIILTAAQMWIVNKMILPKIKSSTIQKNMKVIFTG